MTTHVHTQEFAGDKKNLIHFLVPYEKKFIEAAVPWVPKGISTAHLTLMTLGWSFGILAAGYFAQYDIRWLWVFSACIFFNTLPICSMERLVAPVTRVSLNGDSIWTIFSIMYF